jgi:hypothetical protein
MKWISNVIYVSINKQLVSFQKLFQCSVLAVPGKCFKDISLFQMSLRGLCNTVSQATWLSGPALEVYTPSPAPLTLLEASLEHPFYDPVHHHLWFSLNHYSNPPTFITLTRFSSFGTERCQKALERKYLSFVAWSCRSLNTETPICFQLSVSEEGTNFLAICFLLKLWLKCVGLECYIHR